ncbi:MAG: ABC transporter transmembrane domain-containing protein, partial [Betaproteobacteria bacterium]
MFAFFERLVDPYPPQPPADPPRSFFAFLWACTKGARPFLLLVTLFTAAIGAFEALLFSMMAHVVDLLGKTPPAELWQRHGSLLAVLGGVLGLSIVFAALQALFKYQGIFGNFPMRLRWNFHRLMLAQSMAFYQDEFAGRISTKVMQTALAVRDTWLIFADILVYVVIYFATMVGVMAAFDAWLMVPFLGWLVLYVATLWYFVPRLGKVAEAQADARSLMTGRITDAYTNIATVKLFSHAQRESHFARGAMQEVLGTVNAQMRLVTAFETVNQLLSVLLIASVTVVSLLLWTGSWVGVGAVAAATAMAFRLNGISLWVMWEMATLFEHIGTVQDGIGTLARPRVVLDREGATELKVTQGEVRFDQVGFSYGGSKKVIEGLDLTIRPGEKIVLVGRSGAGKS